MPTERNLVTTTLPPSSAAQGHLAHVIAIPLGLMDVTVTVSPGGIVDVVSPNPLPAVLHDVVVSVLETWMIALPRGAHVGSTMIPGESWREYFGARAPVGAGA